MVPPLSNGFYDWNGFRLPLGREFDWRGLVEVAWANGFLLSHELLLKWRNWRFLPTPVPGGRTATRAGKGETWSYQCAQRVAWIGTWLLQSLTYDVLRLAMWPWTPELGRERAKDLRRSLRRFIDQDRDFTDKKLLKEPALEEDEIADAYEDVVVTGGGSQAARQKLLIDAGMETTHPRFSATLELLEHLNFGELIATSDEVTDSELAEFMASMRPQMVLSHQLDDSLWFEPLGVARIVVRELHRAFLFRRGRLIVPLRTTS